MDFLFHFSALSVLPFWLPMIFFPSSALTLRLVRSPWIGLPAAFCYLALAAPHVPELLMAFAAPSPESLALVMAKPWAASLFWAYAGTFDLFVGRWIYFDAREQGLNPWFVSPVLFTCAFFGPVGFILYWLLRGIGSLKRK